MSKKHWVTIVVLAMLLFIGAYQNCMAAEEKKKDEQFTTCQGDSLKFVDESNQDESLRHFMVKLKDAVKDKKVDFIKRMLAPKIVSQYHKDQSTGFVSEGTAQDKQAFLKDLDIKLFWKEMETILSMGGSFKDSGKTEFEAPYVHSTWPKNCLRYRYAAIIGKEIHVLPSKDLTGKAITSLSDMIVEADYSDSDNNSVKIIIPNSSQSGYVEAKSIRSYYDYSVRFVKNEDGQWRIVFFAQLAKTMRGIPDCKP